VAKIEHSIEKLNDGRQMLRVKIEKRGKGVMTPENTPIQYVHQLFIAEQRGKGNSDSTVYFYDRCFRKFLAFVIGTFLTDEIVDELAEIADKVKKNEIPNPANLVNIPITILDAEQIDGAYREYLSDVVGLNDVTIDSHFRAYRAFAYYAMEYEWIEKRKIVVRDTQPVEKECYTEQEIKLLLAKPDTRNFTEYRNWVIINYLIACGNRIGSIVEIKIKDVYLEQGYVYVHKQKNKKPDTVPLIARMRNILYEYITIYRIELDGVKVDENEPLFCGRYGNKLTTQGLYKALSEYNKARGVNKTSIHLFRHSFAKDWIVRGGDLFSLKKILGHSSLRMVQRYSNLYTKDVNDKAEKFSMLANMPVTSGKTLSGRGKSDKSDKPKK